MAQVHQERMTAAGRGLRMGENDDTYNDGRRDQKLENLEARVKRLEAALAFVVTAISGAWAAARNLWD